MAPKRKLGSEAGEPSNPTRITRSGARTASRSTRSGAVLGDAPTVNASFSDPEPPRRKKPKTAAAGPSSAAKTLIIDNCVASGSFKNKAAQVLNAADSAGAELILNSRVRTIIANWEMQGTPLPTHIQNLLDDDARLQTQCQRILDCTIRLVEGTTRIRESLKQLGLKVDAFIQMTSQGVGSSSRSRTQGVGSGSRSRK